MREKQGKRYARIRRLRITPAYAGKTIENKNLLDEKEDHPRVCGKNYSLFSVADNTTGSPPRMREKRLVLIT